LRTADNFYYPPDWTPESGSLNKFAGCPPGNLGKRAKKLDQGILVIRCVSLAASLPLRASCGAGCARGRLRRDAARTRRSAPLCGREGLLACAAAR
jgi:hypothetical protein